MSGERGAVGYVPKVGDRIRIRRPHGGSETGRVRSSWPDLREGYADLDRKGRCPECEQPTPRGERFRYDEVAPLSDSPQDARCPHGFPSGGWDCCRHDPSLDDHMEDT